MTDNFIYGIKCWDKFPNITVSIEIITPQVAIAMLGNNIDNRKPKSKEAISEAILNGDWYLNGATIVFSNDGRLLDGQHRLMACVRTNIPITSIVVRGVDDYAQSTMDQTFKRTVKDFLDMKGYKKTTNTASVGRQLYQTDRCEGNIEAMLRRNSTDSIPVKQIVDFIDANYESRIKPIIKKCENVNSRYKGVSFKVTAPIFDALRAIDVESFEYFYGMLMGEYTPTLTMKLLQNKLMANAQSEKGRLPNILVAAYIIKTWNAFMDGEELGCLKFTPGGVRPEQFPTISHGIDTKEEVA